MAKKKDKEENFLIKAAKGVGSSLFSGLSGLGSRTSRFSEGAEQTEESATTRTSFGSISDFLKKMGSQSANFIGMGGRPPKEMEGLVKTPEKQFEPTTYDIDTEKFTVIDPTTGSEFTNRRGNPIFYKAIPVPEDYRSGIRKAYEKYQRMPKGILEAVIAKESMFGKNLPKGEGFIGKYGGVVGMRRPAFLDLKQNGMEPDLDTLDGTIMAMADYLTIRNAAIQPKDPEDLYMRGYYGRPEASIDHEIFREYMNRYKVMYPEIESEITKGRVSTLNILNET